MKWTIKNRFRVFGLSSIAALFTSIWITYFSGQSFLENARQSKVRQSQLQIVSSLMTLTADLRLLRMEAIVDINKEESDRNNYGQGMRFLVGKIGRISD